jgi:hypothetical protein
MALARPTRRPSSRLPHNPADVDIGMRFKDPSIRKGVMQLPHQLGELHQLWSNRGFGIAGMSTGYLEILVPRK